MANYATLKAAIQQVIKTNGNEEITGALLQQSLLAMINSLGDGYLYMGIATPKVNPGTPDQNVFYFALASGTYTDFGGIVIAEGETAILRWDSTWHKDTIEVDAQADWNEADTSSPAYIKNKPTIPTQKQSDWDEDDTSSPAYIKNKPTIPTQKQSDWDEDDTSSPAYIKNKPTIPTQKQSDWDEDDTSSPAYIKNKPTIPTVPTDVLKYTEQTLTDVQKAQSRTNIGAASYSDVNQLGREVDELVNGEKVPEYVSLEDIGVAIQNTFMDFSTGKPNGAANCIITKPIYLEVGDVVSCETGGTGLALFFSLNDGSQITTSTSVKQIIKVANNYSQNTTYEATIEEAGWYGFSGRNNRNDGTNLVVSVTKYSRGEGIVDRVDGISEQVDGIVNGETSSEEITLNEIDGDGALLNYFLNYNLEKPNGASNCIITKPIYLNVGDHVECQTGGTGVGLFAKSPSGSISQITTGFVTIVQANSWAITTYSANIEEEGWYVFSGRINRTDGTNLAVTITKFVQGKGIYELLDEKANKKDIGDLNIPSVGLSIGADSVKDNIPTTPWFDADADSEGMDYGTYLDDKLDSVPFGKRFIFITDCHYDGGNKGAAPLIDYARRRLGIKTIIHGGDIHNEAVTAQDAVGKWLQFNRDFVFRIGNDFKQVLGDHDRNGGSGHTPISYEVMQRLLDGYNANELVFDNLYDEQVSTLGWSAADMSQYDAFKRMHYYFDDVSIKTRFVVLVTRIIPQGQGLVYDKLGDYDSEVLLLQMDFLYEALMSTPDGYNVVVCGHNAIGNQGVSGHPGWYDTSIPIYKGYWRSVAKHIRAFKSKGTCNTPYLNWESSGISTKDYDYSGAGNVNIVFCIGGDVHWDILAKSQATNEDLANVISGTTINTDDILHVVTMTDGTDRGYRDANGELIMHPATPGTIDSQAFDIVTIAEDGVHFTRIGSGNDRVVYFSPPN